MPHIIVTAGDALDSDRGRVMLRERVSAADFESDHFAAQLVQRLGWAVGDATEVEYSTTPDEDDEPETHRELGEPYEDLAEADYAWGEPPRSDRLVTTAS